MKLTQGLTMILELKEIYLPAIMSIFLAYIAYQQMRINKEKLKLDLYNKRFEIYSCTLKFKLELENNQLTSETHQKFIEVKNASKFLFSSDNKIYESLDEIHDKSFKITGFRNESEKLKNHPESIKARQECEEAFKKIQHEFDILNVNLSKYLNFK